MKRILIAKIISLVATVMSCIVFFFLITGREIVPAVGACLVFAPMLALVSYCFCGFLKAIGTPFSAAKWGFVMAPFHVNLFAVLIMFILGLLAVCYIPVIPVFKRATEWGQ